MQPDFADIVRAHLPAAYNLARWLVRDASAAEDVVQDAMLRALKYFPSFRGENARAWLLQIVRNAAYAAQQQSRAARYDRHVRRALAALTPPELQD